MVLASSRDIQWRYRLIALSFEASGFGVLATGLHLVGSRRLPSREAQ
jgi:hypothetical protein